MTNKMLVKAIGTLGIAGILVKILGAIFRIPLANIIGPEGMATYQPAYNLYTVFIAIATVGLPVAISRIYANKNRSNASIEEQSQAQAQTAHKSSGGTQAQTSHQSQTQILVTSIRTLMAIAIPAAIILFIFSDYIGQWLNIPEASLPIKALCPAIIFVAVAASVRGYFQGEIYMVPSAVSQVLEQLIRVGAGLTLGYCLFTFGTEHLVKEVSNQALGALGAVLGATLGTMAGMIVILIFFEKARRKEGCENLLRSLLDTKKKESWSEISRLLRTTLVITSGAAIFQIFNLVESPIVVNGLLRSHMPLEAAQSLYGQLSGMVYPIVNLPYIIISAIGITLVPYIAQNINSQKGNQIEEAIATGVSLTGLITIPATVGLLFLNKSIIYLLYPMQHSELTIPKEAIIILALALLALALCQLTTAIVQGAGLLKMNLIIIIIGIMVKIGSTYIGVAIDNVGITGSAVGTLLGIATIVLGNLIIIKKSLGINICRILVKNLKKPLLGSCGMLIAMTITSLIIANIEMKESAATLWIILVAIISYGPVLFFGKKSLVKEYKKIK